MFVRDTYIMRMLPYKEVTLQRSQSFAMYTKEYDVFTGDLKQRFDEVRLRNEEDRRATRDTQGTLRSPPECPARPALCKDAYLKKMRSMVGGSKMKKLLYPGGLIAMD